MFSGAVGVAGYMGYLLYRSPVIGGTLFMISLLQLLPPLIVKIICRSIMTDAVIWKRK